MYDRNLLHMSGKSKLEISTSTNFLQSSDLTNIADNADIQDLEHDIVNVNMHDNDENSMTDAEIFLPMDSGHIQNLLLTSDSHIMTEIRFFLLCGKHQDVWSSFDGQKNTV